MKIITDIAAQRLIENEIAQTEDPNIIRQLKTRRNTHAAIFSLPDDILPSIFVHFKQTLPIGHSIIVDQVCSHWREVALNTPHVWSGIKVSDLSRGEWPSIKIQRSKSVPLSLNLSIPGCASPPESKPFWALVTHIISRKLSIDQLVLTGILRMLTYFLTLATKNDQSLLYSLSIYCEGQILTETSLHLWRDMPSLQSLTLYNVPMPDALPFLPRLVNFHATGVIPHNLTTVTWLVHALSSMPVIETIYVFNLCDGRGTIPETLSLPITLPCLQKLDIFFQDSSASRLFEYLDIPSSSVSCVFLSGPRHTLAYAPCAASLFDRWIKALAEDKPLELRLDYSFDLGLSIRSPQTNKWWKIAFSYRGVPTRLRLTLFDLLPLDAFTTMSFIQSHPDSLTELAKLLPRLNALRQIIFGIYPANTINCLFKTPSDETPPLPKLELLEVSSKYLPEIRTLEALVRERQQCGMPIKRVTFRGWHVRAAQMTGTLRTLVEVDIL